MMFNFWWKLIDFELDKESVNGWLTIDVSFTKISSSPIFSLYRNSQNSYTEKKSACINYKSGKFNQYVFWKVDESEIL